MKPIKLLTDGQRAQLLNHGRCVRAFLERGEETPDFWPVVKLFCPWGAATWLLAELDPDDPDRAFGLCDLGLGDPELGMVRLSELEALRGPGGLRIERDRHFKPKKFLSLYLEDARAAGRVEA